MRSEGWPSWLVVGLGLVGPVVVVVVTALAVSGLMDLVPYAHTMQGVNAKDVDTKYAVLTAAPVVLLAFGYLVCRRAKETARVVFLMFAIPVSLLLEGLLFFGSVAK